VVQDYPSAIDNGLDPVGDPGPRQIQGGLSVVVAPEQYFFAVQRRVDLADALDVGFMREIPDMENRVTLTDHAIPDRNQVTVMVVDRRPWALTHLEDACVPEMGVSCEKGPGHTKPLTKVSAWVPVRGFR